MTAQTNAELAGRAIAGSQQAWDEIVERFTRLVWHVVLGFDQLNSQTQADVHQTVWLRLSEHLERIDDPDRMGSWLATTARRECLRQIDVARREVPTDVIQLSPVDQSLDLGLLEAERDAELWTCFRQLRPQCQQLLRLRLADPPFSYDEIAEILDMSRGSIGPTLRRCLDAFKSKLGDNAKEELQ